MAPGNALSQTAVERESVEHQCAATHLNPSSLVITLAYRPVVGRVAGGLGASHNSGRLGASEMDL